MVTHDPAAAERARIIRQPGQGAAPVTLRRLAARNPLRNKFRTLLTVLGVRGRDPRVRAAAHGASYAWTSRRRVRGEGPRRHAPQGDVRDDAAEALHRATSAGAGHVKVATYANWFGGKDPQATTTSSSPTLAVDATTLFDVYTEMKRPAGRSSQTWKDDKQGRDRRRRRSPRSSAGRSATRSSSQGASTRATGSSTSTASTRDRQSRSIRVRPSVFHWDVPERRPARPAEGQDRLDRRAASTTRRRRADVGVAIDKLFDDSDIADAEPGRAGAATRRSSPGSRAILDAIDIMSIVILVIMMLILGNTIAMGVRERTTEYGVLRAIGFLPGHIRSFIVGEAITLSLVVGGPRAACSRSRRSAGVGRWLEENMGQFFPVLPDDGAPPRSPRWCSRSPSARSRRCIPAVRAGQLQVIDALRRIA